MMMRFRGSLEQIPASSLLRYFAIVKKTGICIMTSPEREAQVELMKGLIGEVTVDGQPRPDRREALTSLFDWTGTFDVDPAQEKKTPPLAWEGTFDLAPPTRRTAEPLTIDDVLPA